MRPGRDSPDERFAAYVRERGERHLRVAVLLTGDWHAAENLVQASLVKLHRAWPRLTAGLTAGYQRLCRAAIGSPGHSCMARRLSRAG
jgi:DNA-directed RNA polymerase specialized sigma24 family protein